MRTAQLCTHTEILNGAYNECGKGTRDLESILYDLFLLQTILHIYVRLYANKDPLSYPKLTHD